jgi:hypothetical protein
MPSTSKRYETTVTPIGEAGFVHVGKPNQFGDYSVQLALPDDVADQLEAVLVERSKDAQAHELKNAKDRKKLAAYKLHSEFSKPLTDKDGNEIEGMKVFTFKNKAVVQPKGKAAFNVEIDIRDAQKRKVPPTVRLGRGSKIRVAFDGLSFAMAATKLIGFSPRLKAVQILELKEFGSGAGETFDEADGYSFDGGDTGGDQSAGESSGEAVTNPDFTA